ncbi:hypothetical protein FSP39_018655 [Pinctada imbricata]|uniref:non-specific serine/threonine protein kinase n=1 Tax=Pinctada imbricata TaxID=66713 RepID=A0AA89C0E7_PINIB|nr:hypothetical protein FSP39_018655 [Pinctada imbricata]
MASKKKGRDRMSTFIYDLPYSITREICQNLDIDKAWERLACEIGYTSNEVNIFELALGKVNDSPTKQILADWGARNPTARDLYSVLQKIKRRRETQILEAWFNGENGRGASGTSGSKNFTGMSSSSLSSETPSMVLRVLEDVPLPKPPGKGGKSSKNSTGYSTSSMNNSSVSSNGNVNLNKPDDMKASQSQKHFKSFDKGYEDKFMPVKGDYLNKMKETMGIPEKGKEKSGEQHCSMSSSSSIREAHCETDGPAESKGNMATEKMVDNSWMETLKNQEGYNTLAKDGMCELEIAVALIGTQSFTYKELNQATNGFSDEYKIGEGAFGEVYKGALKNTKCAIKKLYTKQECNDESHNVQGHLKSELKTLIRYRHENIVPLYGYTLDGSEVCLVYQYMQNGSLEDKLRLKGGVRPLTWSMRLSIMKGAACGLQYLHTLDHKPLIHGDIKSANILLDKHLEPKIGDLGLAQHATGGSGTKKLTHITKKQSHSKQYQCMAYLPPEAQRGTQMSIKGDTFSFGVVMMEIFTGQLAYDEDRTGGKFLCQNLEEQVGDELGLCVKHVDQLAGQCPADTLTEFYSIAHRCTQNKKKDRPDMVDVYTQLERLEEQFSEDGQSGFGGKSGVCDDKTIMDKISFTSSGHYSPGLMEGQPQTYASVGNGSQVDIPPMTGAPQILKSLPPGYPIPEPLRMQMKYDAENGHYDSDPQKLSKMMKFDQAGSENSVTQHCSIEKVNPPFKRSDSIEKVIDELDKVKLEIGSANNSRKNSYVKEEPGSVTLPHEEVETKEEDVTGISEAPAKTNKGMMGFFAKYEEYVMQELGDDEDEYDDEYDEECEEYYEEGDEEDQNGDYMYEEDNDATLTETTAVNSTGSDTPTLTSGMTGADVISTNTYSDKVSETVDTEPFHPSPIETSESIEEDGDLIVSDSHLFDDDYGSVTASDLFCDSTVHGVDVVQPINHNAFELQQKFLKEKRNTEPTEGECFV